MQISKWRMMAFASFAAPVTAITAQISVYLPAYYTQEIGLSLVEVGVVFTVLRIFDLITDILFGIAVDKRPFVSGKYRPWILISIPVLMASCWFLYVPDRDLISTSYIFMVGLVLYSGYTLAGISHQSWCSEIAKGSNMTRIFGYREYAVILGILGSALVPVIVEVAYKGSFEDKVNSIGYFLVVTLPIFGLICSYSADDIQSDTSGSYTNAVSFKAMLGALKDADLLKLVSAKCLYFMMVGAGGTMAAFVVQSAFKASDVFATAMAAYMVVAFLSVPIWLMIARHWDEWIALRVAAVTAMVALLTVLPALYIGGSRATLVYFAISGITFAAGPILLRSMIGKLADHYVQARGTEMRGVMFGLGLFSEKIGTAVAIGGSLAILQLIGFDPTGGNDPQTIRKLVMAYLAIPLLSQVCITLITCTKRPEIDWSK